MVAGPGLWVLSQLLLLVYFWLDNGANTCGIDFHFGNNKNKVNLKEEGNENEESPPEGIKNSRSNSEDASKDVLSSSINQTEDDSKSIINDDEPREDTYFEFKVFEELFISEFKVISDEGR